MKTYKYKIVTLALLLLAISVQAQKFDKKITEKFKVNSDVVIEILADNTDVNIETWNRNEVSIEAVIEVEGVSKKEAEKIFKNWNFEALGNKRKVEITSLSDNFEFNFDFNFDFDFPEANIEIPHFDMPNIEFAEFEMPDMPEIPEMHLEELDFDYEMYKKDSSYLKTYKAKVAKQVKKFKNSDWKKKHDSVLNSDEYKHKMDELKKATQKMAKEVKELKNSKEFKNMMIESKKIAEEVRREMLENKSEFKEQMKEAKEASKMAMEMIKKMKEEGKFDSINHGENVYFHFKDKKNSKVKIRKYFKVKVPKKATFDLNVRHGKLNVPNSNTKMSANLSYGNFVGGIIEGDNELKFSNSPVLINTINSGNITLKNVPNATFGTFSNANLFSNSSDVVIEKVGNDVALSLKFGSLGVLEIAPNFKNLNVILDYAKGTLNLSDASFIYNLNSKKSTIFIKDSLYKSSKSKKDGVDTIQGFFEDKSSSNKLFVTGVYSTVNLN
ncbi:MAG: hypothetical protein GQ540_07480 [Lutibacter sp.]|uniref:hypothetical protein n=1 Tax=Lutibacter sp. TaxID=1925666 RepID=UPI0019FDE992|nr:hypothetical protein [Lutibacter sp.]NOR28353.1 hypothetical protein [Lutibacter sp.]